MVFQINREHIACTSKDTTFLDTWSGVITPELGRELGAWLEKGAEPVRCADCRRAILPTSKRSVEQLAAASTAKFGRVLCAACATALLNRQEEEKNATQN